MTFLAFAFKLDSMKKLTLLLVIALLWACQNTPDIKSPRPEPEETERMIPLETFLQTVESVIHNSNRACGSVEVDPETGERITIPEVDLLVSNVEVRTTEYGAWITPTIKNDCDEPASGLFMVGIYPEDRTELMVVTVMGDIPANTEVTLGHAIGVLAARSYTVIVDVEGRIDESNEGNNRCVVVETGSCN